MSGTNPFRFGLSDLYSTNLGRAGVLPATSRPQADSPYFFSGVAAIDAFTGSSATSAGLDIRPPQIKDVTTSDPTRSFAFIFTASVPEPERAALSAPGAVALAIGGGRRRQPDRS